MAEVSSVINRAFFKDEIMWNHTSSSMALLANINTSKGKKFKSEDFNPYVKMGKPNANQQTAEDLLETFKNF